MDKEFVSHMRLYRQWPEKNKMVLLDIYWTHNDLINMYKSIPVRNRVNSKNGVFKDENAEAEEISCDGNCRRYAHNRCARNDRSGAGHCSL